MKAQWLLTVVVSLILAGVAAMYANNMLNERMRAVEMTEVELFPVVAAASTIPTGTKIEPLHLKVVQIPSDAKAAGAYTDEKELIGQVAKQTVFAGEIIIADRFADSVGGSALAAVIPAGKRAITVSVNQEIGVSGFIVPGSRVDVIAIEDDRPKTILQNLKVLAVGKLLSQEKGEPVDVSAVTLEVDPRQAEIVTAASGDTRKRLRLTLRNPSDSIVVAEPEPEPTAAPEVGALSEPPVAQSGDRVPSPLYVVDIVRGTEVQSTSMAW
jgi:pilus assembly protein CpaB